MVGAMTGIVDHEQVSLVVDFDSQLPARICGDPLRVRHVLSNLLSNAVKFTPSGHIAVRVSMLDPKRWRVGVSDTGIGIDDTILNALFEPFTQADSSTSRNFGGTGLGLSICKQLIEMMGGRIDATSRPGHGSEFWFELPLEQKQAPREFADSIVNGARALILEKDEISAEVLGNCLKSFEVASASVASCDSLLERLEAKTKPDIIFIDAGLLLAANGLQLLSAIHARYSGFHPQIIVLSSLGSHFFESDLYHTALLKPIRREELFNVLSGAGDTAIRTRTQHGDSGEQQQQVEGRVLLVDDNPMNLQVAAAMLKRLGIDVDTADSGKSALAQLDQEQYRLVLMDEQMPEMDGLETTRNIRLRSGEDKDIPIIALTANADSASEKRCLDAGMNGFLSKPVRRKQLRTTLGQFLPELLTR